MEHIDIPRSIFYHQNYGEHYGEYGYFLGQPSDSSDITNNDTKATYPSKLCKMNSVGHHTAAQAL